MEITGIELDGNGKPATQGRDVPGEYLTIGAVLAEQVFEPFFGPLGYVEASGYVEQAREV